MRGWISLLHIILSTHHARCAISSAPPPHSPRFTNQSSHPPVIRFPDREIKTNNNSSSKLWKSHLKTSTSTPLFGSSRFNLSVGPLSVDSEPKFATFNSSLEFLTLKPSLVKLKPFPSPQVSSPNPANEFSIYNPSPWNSSSIPPPGTLIPVPTLASSSDRRSLWGGSETMDQMLLLRSAPSSSSSSFSSISLSSQSVRPELQSEGQESGHQILPLAVALQDQRGDFGGQESSKRLPDVSKNRKNKRSAKDFLLSEPRNIFISENTWAHSSQRRKSFRNRNSNEGRSEKRFRHPTAEEEMPRLRFADYFLEDDIHGKGTMRAEEMRILPVSPTSSRTPSVFSPSNSRSHFRCRRDAGRGKRSALRCKRRSFLGGGPPSFLPSSPKNITAQLGASALLPCRIKNLGNKSVSWFRKRDSHILTVDRTPFIADDRFSAWHEGSTQSWTLRIQYAQFRDAGDYECQVSTVPKMSHTVRLTVLKPSAQIAGAPDHFVRAGSTVSLTCELHNAVEEPSFIFWYQNGLRVVDSEGTKRVISAPVRTASDRHVSSLTIARAVAADSGNYTCAPASIDPASVTLHVLHDEHPAAMQHGTTNAAAAATAAAATTAATAAMICQSVMFPNVRQPTATAVLAIIGSTILGSTFIGHKVIGSTFIGHTVAGSTRSTSFWSVSTLTDIWRIFCERCSILRFSVIHLFHGVYKNCRNFFGARPDIPAEICSNREKFIGYFMMLRFLKSKKPPRSWPEIDEMENITVTELKFHLVPPSRGFTKDAESLHSHRNIRASST